MFFDATTGGTSTLLRGIKNAVFKEDIEPETAEALIKLLLNPNVIPQNIRQPFAQRAGEFVIPRLNRQNFTGAISGGVGAGLIGPEAPAQQTGLLDVLNQ